MAGTEDIQDLIHLAQQLRESSNVRRCHVVPHHGEYTVGKHSYDATVLLLLLHPDPDVHLLKLMMLHDAAERWVGDMPAPAKWHNSALGAEYVKAERDVFDKLDLFTGPYNTNKKEDSEWVSAIDRLELWLWAHDQLALGNQHVKHFIPALEQWFELNWENIPRPVQGFFRSYKWERTPERL